MVALPPIRALVLVSLPDSLLRCRGGLGLATSRPMGCGHPIFAILCWGFLKVSKLGSMDGTVALNFWLIFS